MELTEIGLACMDWIDLAKERTSEGHFKCRNEPSGCIKFGEYLE
jgi:hypothetical protein